MMMGGGTAASSANDGAQASSPAFQPPPSRENRLTHRTSARLLPAVLALFSLYTDKERGLSASDSGAPPLRDSCTDFDLEASFVRKKKILGLALALAGSLLRRATVGCPHRSSLPQFWIWRLSSYSIRNGQARDSIRTKWWHLPRTALSTLRASPGCFGAAF